ncbi:MAG: response regulator transcription factor [Acidimicrobiales bacterium]
MGTTVVVIEDHELVAAALKASLDREADLVVTGLARSIPEAVAALARHRPHVAVTDLRLGAGSSVDHLGELRASSPTTRLLVLTGWPTQQSMLDALEAGAAGYLSKTRPLSDLVDAIHRVARGETVVDPEMLDALVHPASPAERLSSREVEVLEHLSQGSTTAEMASALNLSAHTVRSLVGAVLRKLGVHTRVEAVGEGLRRGLITPGPPG